MRLKLALVCLAVAGIWLGARTYVMAQRPFPVFVIWQGQTTAEEAELRKALAQSPVARVLCYKTAAEVALIGMEDAASSQGPDFVFVRLVGADAGEGKKRLRRATVKIEGAARPEVLHRMVPVYAATMSTSDTAQLCDNLIYAQDNFGGVGLQMVPGVDASAVSSILSDCLDAPPFGLKPAACDAP